MNSISAAGWKPIATVEAIRLRARILTQIRQFFAERNVIEVETPILSRSALAHPSTSVMNISANNSSKETLLYLQTSPESAMKRLVASGIGPIFQVCKAFRNGEADRYHNPEFSILEWYRPGWDLDRIATELDELLRLILRTSEAHRIYYNDVFRNVLHIDWRQADIETLCTRVNEVNIKGILATTDNDRDDLLEMLMKHVIEPTLGHDRPAFVFDYPSSQACLARVRPMDGVAARFEVFIKGLEIANGYDELSDPHEHRRRFAIDNEIRVHHGLEPLPIDELLIAAMESGFPSCAGVAVGLDRLTMVAAGVSSIKDVITFPTDQA